ncbi:DUF397 domain-containing protein [Streptomyces longispororuber]|uniref:DUF397 domain-containing protein n=1 Tax=Streptomyces longispororuber TaxID=68230 RepID=UPI00210D40B3|nr:DUF397 domain-containing protein [Streptomyces longispororuber]MCQ4214419.1 DUF397 domain-containing protein [Streptomyces longispororuber]
MSTAAELKWFKSTYSSDEGGACLEIATRPHAIHIRDSKNPTGPTFTVRPEAWSVFAGFVKG